MVCCSLIKVAKLLVAQFRNLELHSRNFNGVGAQVSYDSDGEAFSVA